MTTVYPSNIDDNTSLPQTIDLKTPVRAEVVNNLREAIIAVENELGIDPSSTYGTVRDRLDDMQRGIGNAGSPIDVQQNGTTIVSEVELLNFSGGVSIVAGAGKTANIFISGGDGYRPIYEQLSLTTNGQTAFTLTHLPIDSSLVLLFISGIKRQYNVDYTVSGADITYNNDPPLVAGTDIVDVLYFIEQSGGGGGGTGSDLTPPTIAENGNVAIANNEDLSYLAGSNPGDVLSWDGYAWISQAATGGSVETITTIELDTNLVLKPDGYGGVVWGIDESVASLMEVLSIGNTTDGYNIIVSSGDKLLGESNLILESLDGYIGLYASDGVTGRPIYIIAGDSSGADGGGIQVTSGASSNSSYKTGFVNIVSQNIATGTTGNITLLSGNQTNNTTGGASGTVSVKSGDMYGGGSSGAVTLATGAHVTPTSTASSGNMTINTGNISGTSGSTGHIQIESGSGTNVSGGITSGSVSILSGDSASNGSSGAIAIQTGNVSGSGASGNISITVGQCLSGTGGNITLQTGRGSSLANDGYFVITQRGFNNYWPRIIGTNGQSLCTTDSGSLYWGAPSLSKILAEGNTADGYNVIINGGDLSVYGDGYFSGKLTVTGLIDPTGLVLDNQATTPGGNPASGKTTIWVRASDNHLVYTNSSGTVTDVSVSSGGLTAPTTPAQDGYVTIANGGDLTYLAGTNINDVLSWNGSAWVASVSSGGAGTLKQTLSLGNVTDGYDIIISNGDVIEFGSDVTRPTIQFDADNASFNILSGKSNNGNSNIMIRIADTDDGDVYSSVGSIMLYGGDCYVSGDGYSGGEVYIYAGNYDGTATSSVGGNINLVAGKCYSSGAGGIGGYINITGGLNESPANITASTPAGNVVIQGGTSSDGLSDGYEGGRIELTGGDKGLDGFQPALSGSVNIRGGDCDGIPGNVTITGGDTTSASSAVGGGNVTIQGGISINGAGGNVILQGGTGNSSGEVQILGDGYVSGKLTVLGLIDPTGLVLDTQSSVPGGSPASGKATLWVRESDGYAILTNSSGTDTVLSGGGSSPGSASETVIDGYLTSSQNDYSPTGWSTATHIRLSSSAGFDITGFASASAPSTRYIINVGSYNLTLKHNSGSSSVGNKLKIPGGIDFVLEPDDVATIWKDPTSNIWRIL